MTSSRSKNNKNYFKEIIKGAQEPIKIIVVCFAKETKKWPESFKRERKRFLFLKKKIDFILASNNPDIFAKQVKWADIVDIQGGNTLLLCKNIKKVKNLNKIIKDKIVAGSSAGANIIAKYYYSNDRKKIENGLSILPIKVFAHYSKKMISEFNNLKKYKEKLKIYSIPETEFVIIKKIK